MIEILPIKAFSDNYIWLIKKARDVIIVDPGDATPVIDYLNKHELTIAAILITHHHSDHIGGVELLQNFQNTSVYAPSYGNYHFNHIPVSNNDKLTIAQLDIEFEVMWLPGHTRDHVAYQYDKHVFCGDVIFGAGCGRIFDGTLEDQFKSLNRLKTLPSETLLYCAHEYTQHNIAFSLTLDAQNQNLVSRQKQVNAARRADQSTVPLLLETELKTNPFLRCNEASLKSQSPLLEQESFAFFSEIRKLRNHY